MRPLGEGHNLVGISTSLGVLVLLVRDDACVGNLYTYLKGALVQRLADDLLGVAATKVPTP